MKTKPQDQIASLADEIKDYLASHSQQMDTLRGIVSWWWELERYRKTRALIEKALERLVADGIVRVREVSGEKLYCLFRDEQEDN
ncbi:MAG: hypothetical protein HKP58_13080 [Desulfatitalea sp.]|nr:hypothetical protein [Desulfatitalea sp.]